MKMDIKKHISVVACLCLLLILTACQKQPTWQEQYDLGMRYLTESNYEEAILAFTAAIEIDPNQLDTYVYLIQTYLATGDVEKAEATRLQGYEATGNIRLGQSVRNGWIIYDNNIPFEQRITYRLFDALSAEQQEAIQALLTAIQTDERETVRELLLTSGLPPQLCTTLDGYKISISIMERKDLGESAYQTFIEHYYQQKGSSSTNNINVNIELMTNLDIRSENDSGYIYQYSESADALAYEDGSLEYESTAKIYNLEENLYTAHCTDWQYNGEWKYIGQTDWTPSAEMYGMASNNIFKINEGFYSGTHIIYEWGNPGTLRSCVSFSNGGQFISEYQDNWLTAYYWINPDGSKIDYLSSITNEERMLDKDPGVIYIAERF